MIKRGRGARFWAADKAFYADEKTIQYVRPGLEIKLTSAEIDSAGAIEIGR